MASTLPTHPDLAGCSDAEQIRQSLAGAWRIYMEDPAQALAEAVRCHEVARWLEDAVLCARARALQGATSLHRGDLSSAIDLVFEAQRYTEHSQDEAAHAEVAALKAQVNFFTGSYPEALREAETAVALADGTGDLDLRIVARRATCMVFGNLAVPDLPARVEQLLELTQEAGYLWEESISRNDLAVSYQDRGALEAAEREIERALEVAGSVTGPNTFARGLIHSSRSDIRLLQGRPEDALADAQRSLALLTASGEPNPYVLAATVRGEVQARAALGQLDRAQRSGEGALEWLGERLPQTRGLILSTLACALRDAGRVEEAYDALARAAEVEREAFRELTELQLRLERATLEASAARRESDVLAAKNRQLASAHVELERRTTQLEEAQSQLRDQAERDPLTGLHNRRYLAQELDRVTHGELAFPVSLAVLDLDHFKAINDRFGHDAGDQVLVRVAGLLCEALRASDVVIRSGGEEFLVLMPMTDAAAASACARRINQAIHGERWNQVSAELTVTASVGVATTHALKDLGSLVKLADERLYQAKRAGRDRIVDGAGDLR
jgi:diguanylate cyclase (GGDEF)-like protein